MRSAIPKVELESTVYSALEKFPGNQAPTGVEIMGRMMYLTSKEVQHSFQYSVETAAQEVSRELQDIMIFNLNLYPLAIKDIKKKVLGDYTDFKKLQHYPKQRRSADI